MTESIRAWVKDPTGPTRPIDPQTNNFNDASRLLPEGVYTTLRTYDATKILDIENQLQRLNQSAQLLGSQINFTQETLRDALRVAIYDNTFFEKRIRLQISLSQPTFGRIYVITEALRIPEPQSYLEGVSVVTRHMHRENAQAKFSQFIQTAESARKELAPGVNEVLMIGEEGDILEGLSSNFFGVRQEKIWTAEKGVLPGITRKYVLLACERIGLEVVHRPIPHDTVTNLTEAFITSASRGVLPVVKIDQIVIGNGLPGETTKRISREYGAIVLENLEEI